MRRRPEDLTNRRFDLLVVGGGIAGCMAAWDAALRGFSVALVERGDFGAATSAGCYRVIHGGLRHLQGLNLRAMRESIRERSFFLRALPGLVRPAPFLLPTRRGQGLLSGYLPVAAAIQLNDWISRDRNEGMHDPASRIPPGRLLSSDETRALCPFLPAEGLTGGAVFFDGIMANTERVVYAVAEAAARAGAVVVNHAEAFAGPQNGVLTVRDRLGGAEFGVQATAVLRATGPWLDHGHRRAYSAGIQLVSDPVPTGGHVLCFRTSGGKSCFAMPWRGVTVWGTADEPYDGDPSAWSIREEDIAAFVARINTALPAVQLRRAQIRLAFGGLRPLGSESSAGAAARTTSFGCRDGVFWMEAAKFTTARALAGQVVSGIASILGRPVSACPTSGAALPVPDDSGDLAIRARRAVREESACVPGDVCRRLGLGQTGPLSPGETEVVESALRDSVAIPKDGGVCPTDAIDTPVRPR